MIRQPASSHWFLQELRKATETVWQKSRGIEDGAFLKGESEDLPHRVTPTLATPLGRWLGVRYFVFLQSFLVGNDEHEVEAYKF